MRRNSGDLRTGADIDCRAVGVLHSAPRALRRFANVIDEQVSLVRRAAHQLDFVFRDFTQHVFYVGLFPVVTMNHHCDRRIHSSKLK